MIDDRILIPEGIDRNQYWAFQVKGIAGEYILYRLTKYTEKAKVQDIPVLVTQMNGETVFLLNKQFVQDTDVSRHTGVPIQQLEEMKVIRLIERETPDLPKPTVTGWGEG